MDVNVIRLRDFNIHHLNVNNNREKMRKKKISEK